MDPNRGEQPPSMSPLHNYSIWIWMLIIGSVKIVMYIIFGIDILWLVESYP